ncbi:MAG: EpsG family protein [Treponema sp.]|nr:EpsG family protein [Treponema sp.]
MIYYTILTFLILFSLLEFCGIGKMYVCKQLGVDKIAFIYIAFLLFCIAAFRYETGRDWEGYTYFFNKCLSSPYSFNFEFGFSFINRFFKTFVDNFYFMQFFIMLFCCICTYRSLYQRSEYPVFTLFLYFVMFFLQTDMAQTRQHIAMAILICGLHFIDEKKIILWIVTVLLAMQFHISALTAFPLYFTTRKEISAYVAMFFYILCLFTTFFGLSIIRGMLGLTVSVGFVPERIQTIGNAYLNSKIYGQQAKFGTGLGFLVRYGFISLMLFFYFIQKEKKSSYFLLNFLIALLFQAMGRNFDQFGRIANYYLICGGGLCAYNLLIDCKSFFKKFGVIKLLMCTIFVLFTMYSFYSVWALSSFQGHSYRDDYTPYKSVLFEDIK